MLTIVADCRQHYQQWLLLFACLMLSGGCAGSPFGDTLAQSLEADPQLAEQAPSGLSDSESDPNVSDPVTASTPESTPAPTASPNSNPTLDPTESAPDKPDQVATLPQPGDPDFIGPIWPQDDAALSPEDSAPIAASPSTFPDLNTAPEELQAYIRDLAQLGLLSSAVQSKPTGSTPVHTTHQTLRDFQPNQPISRRDYARWLLSSYNRFYQGDTSKRIRLGNVSAQPAFQDVPASDPDFPYIQGLAEAGIIPSPLAGSATAVTFRPDAPLTRKDLLLWKVPLDTRQGLPTATVEAVKETWGFQDAAKIEPLALKAVLADYQNGEVANIRRTFGYTTLFQPDKAVTRAEAAATLWRFGSATEGISAAQVLTKPAAGTSASTSPASTPSTE